MGRWGDDKMYSDPKLESQHIEGNKYEVHLNRVSSSGPGAPFVRSDVIILEPVLNSTGSCWEYFINGKDIIYADRGASQWDWRKSTRREENR